MENRSRIDKTLNRRYWLLDNFEWFLSEAIYHRDHKRYFSNSRYNLWKFNELEGKVKVFDEITE